MWVLVADWPFVEAANCDMIGGAKWTLHLATGQCFPIGQQQIPVP
jgi:hypothetical protein